MVPQNCHFIWRDGYLDSYDAMKAIVSDKIDTEMPQSPAAFMPAIYAKMVTEVMMVPQKIWNTWMHISLKFSLKFKHFHSMKRASKCLLNGSHFIQASMS